MYTFDIGSEDLCQNMGGEYDGSFKIFLWFDSMAKTVTAGLGLGCEIYSIQTVGLNEKFYLNLINYAMDSQK